MGKVTWTKEQRQKVVELNEKGYSRNEIAEILGKSRTSVNQFCYSHGISRLIKFRGEIKEKSIELYKKGYSCPEIGRMLGISGACVYNGLKELGFDTSYRPKVWNELRIKELKELIRTCDTKQEIADKMGRSVGSIETGMVFACGTDSLKRSKQYLRELGEE